MTNQRSLMEQVNVNRARRDATSLDSLNRTLEDLERQLRTAIEPRSDDFSDNEDIADRFAALASRAGQLTAPRHVPAAQVSGLPKYDLSAVAAQLKQLREETEKEVKASINQAEPHNETIGRLSQSTSSNDPLFNRASASRPEASHLSFLRGDLDELKRTVNLLAREESLQSLGNRWDAIDERFDTFTQRNSSAHVSNASLPAKYMQQIDERLDEISRAIVATSQATLSQPAEVDAFERLEARIAALASGERSSDTILKRMGELAERVEHLTAQSKEPAINLDILSEQLAAVMRHLQGAPAAITISDFRDLEDRVLQIIAKLETMPQPATDPTFVEKIDRRFEELTRRLDDHHVMTENSDIRLTDTIESHFEDMARYIAQNLPQTEDTHHAIRSLELQIAGLAEHLVQSNNRQAELSAIPPRLDAIEESMAANRDFVIEAARNAAAEAIRTTGNFSEHDSVIARELADDLKTLEKLARKSEERNSKTFEAIHDTLLKIVDRLASLENGPMPVYRPIAARAEETSIAELPAMKATLAYDPAMDVSPAPDTLAHSETAEPLPEVTLAGDPAVSAVEPSEKKSLFGSLARSLKSRNKQEILPQDPEIDLAGASGEADGKLNIHSDILNRPLEPGSGMPDLNSILKRVRDERKDVPVAGDASSGKADFIAAARRAAQAATSEVESQKHVSSDETDTRRAGLFSRHRKPILLAIGAIMIALAGLQLKNAFLNQPAATDTPTIDQLAAPQPATESRVSAQPAGQADAPASVQNGATQERAASQPAPASVEAVIATQQATPSTIDASRSPTAAVSAPTAAIPSIPVEAGPEPLRVAASAGDSKALFEIGNRYMDGRGVTRDYSKAAEWYNLAAERDFAPAQYRIGNFYEKGLGVARDLAKAKSYYQLAAEQGNASAMHNLAVLFAGGIEGAAPDNEAAVRWFTQAAELGVKDSQFNLGILSAKGVGMPQNLEESYKWFALAAIAGDKDAAQKRDDVAKAMSDGQVERAKAATELWKPKVLSPDANALNVPDGWMESETTTGSIDMEKAIRNIQLILNKHGYDAGGSDGKIGSKTRDAIMAFQKDNGLKPTGSIDKDLVRNLLQKNG
ncbi:peptidoglycan-binding protein [Phyllobacterium endophyticum]|uniref:peptidoglycan-binding protein n=1 Tax=Phyllobacterium endophyticum TaxID=1149773 RepID=UPI001FEF4AE5|nr:peptidoglycan-binding protein [Phyllobacterium endophyticum]